MEENNQRLEQISKQIEEMQSIYDRDVSNGVKDSDQIQQNRKRIIDQLKDELKEIAQGELDFLENKKREIENTLVRIESLKKDKEQVVKAISEINGQSEIIDGKLVETPELSEYKSDLEKIENELASLENNEKDLNGVNKEINTLKDKYGLEGIYRKDSDEYVNLHHIKMSDDYEVVLMEDLKNHDNINVDGMKTYVYSVIGKEGELRDKRKFINLDQDLDFEKINNDKSYADSVKDFLAPERIERYSKESEGKGVVDYVYVGNLQGEQEKAIYDKLSKKEYEYISNRIEKIQDSIEKYGNDKYNDNWQKALEKEENKLESIKSQRPDLYDKEKNEETKDVKPERDADVLYEDLYHTSGEVFVEQPKDEEQIKDEKSLTVMPEKKGILNWFKEKFSKIKEFVTRNKSKDDELDENGQAWQDYVDTQDEKENQDYTSLKDIKDKFINSITRDNKLKEEQQKKAFETVKKWEQQNKKELEQEDDERDL